MENADPDARTDLHTFFEKLVPEDTPWFVHTCEGPDDMPSHIRMALTRTSESVPVSGGRMLLGTLAGAAAFRAPPRPAHPGSDPDDCRGIGHGPALLGYGMSRTVVLRGGGRHHGSPAT